METKIIQDSHIPESKFEKGLRITSNVFLILGSIIFIVLSLSICNRGHFNYSDRFLVSCLNYIPLIYLLKFITIKPKVCQITIVIGMILFIVTPFYLVNKLTNIQMFLGYRIFSLNFKVL